MRMIEPLRKGMSFLRGKRARQVVSFCNAFLGGNFRVAVGNKSELQITDNNVILILGRGLFRLSDQQTPTNTVSSGLNPRGAWTRDTTYVQNDMVFVMERLGYSIDVGGNIEPRFYSTWYWPHTTDSSTEPSANPNCPTIVAPFMDTDPANWPYVYNEVSPGATIYSEGDARGTPFSSPIAPPDAARSWNLISAVMLPMNWGSGLTVVTGGHTLRFCNGILVGDST